MYLSRMELDLTRRDAARALASPSLIHGALEACFPGERRRRLWRVDRLNGRCYVLLFSEDRPDLRLAAAQYAPSAGAWAVKDYRPFLDSIRAGSIFQFRLAANPTFSRCTGSGSRGRVCAHITAEQQKNWLLTRCERYGFRLEADGFEIVRRGILRFSKGTERSNVTLGVCEFEGLLSVTEEALFRAALTEGIGRGKAYGQGLLTVVRPR